ATDRIGRIDGPSGSPGGPISLPGLPSSLLSWQIHAMTRLTTIGFDADDTLWQNEQFFRLTERQFADLLADFAEPEHLSARLLEAEKRNLAHYGFGIKGFTLSMIETALEVTDGK